MTFKDSTSTREYVSANWDGIVEILDQNVSDRETTPESEYEDIDNGEEENDSEEEEPFANNKEIPTEEELETAFDDLNAMRKGKRIFQVFR